MRTSRPIIALLVACGLALVTDADGAPSHSIYEIPVEFDPEPGPIDPRRGVVRVDAPELSVMITGEHLAQKIRGVEARMFGYPQNTMMVVKVLTHSAWRERTSPESEQRRAELRRQMWEQRGRYSETCLWPDRDVYTGYYRYHLLCDPSPNLRAGFYLIDRVPNPDEPAPDTFSFVKGTCRLQVNPAIPEVGAYQRCLFTRKTPWGDRFTFRLHGKNVAYLDQVETHLQGLLAEWRTTSGD